MVTLNRHHLETLYHLAATFPEKTIEQARAVLHVARLLDLETDPHDKALWMCAQCGDPLGQEGPWDSYHDEGYEVYHIDCCPCCTDRPSPALPRSPEC